MIKILLATPMMPPTAGGPATHAKKLYDYFNNQSDNRVEFFNFESLNKYPAGIRHFFAFVQIFYKSLSVSTILCLDGFSVALPSTVVKILLGKKLILRIGGDLVHEQYVEQDTVSMDEFYVKLKAGEINLSSKLKIKLLIQKFVLKNADTIVFTTSWQRDMYTNFYTLPESQIVINNPIDKIDFDNILSDKNKLDNPLPEDKIIFTSITRDVAFKNQKRVKEAIEKVLLINKDVYLETKRGARESCLYKISNSRAYICASISDISPNQVLEALSIGVPVIMTKNSGFFELFKDKNVCRFVEPNNVDDIRDAILEMCEDNIWNNYRINISNLDWPESWDTLLAKYDNLLNTK